ncbi:hypothetical protein D3C72_1453860 [compost metagenome]
MLAHAPVDVHVATAHGGAVVQHLLHERVHGEVLGCLGDAFGQALPLGGGNGGVAGVGPLLVEVRAPVDGVLALEVGEHGVDGVLAFVEGGALRLDHVVAERVAQALRGQLVGVQLARAGVGRDLLVHQRLGERRRVLLVVAQLAEADDVDDHVLLEFHAEIKSELGGQHHGFGIVAIHVQHGRLDHLHDVGAVQRRACVARIGGGETDLVVDDDVHRTARGVPTGLGQRQGFLVHTLASKGRIAVHQHRQHLFAERVSAAVHTGAHRAFNHGVHDFEMGRVERQ